MKRTEKYADSYNEQHSESRRPHYNTYYQPVGKPPKKKKSNKILLKILLQYVLETLKFICNFSYNDWMLYMKMAVVKNCSRCEPNLSKLIEKNVCQQKVKNKRYNMLTWNIFLYHKRNNRKKTFFVLQVVLRMSRTIYLYCCIPNY